MDLHLKYSIDSLHSIRYAYYEVLLVGLIYTEVNSVDGHGL